MKKTDAAQVLRTHGWLSHTPAAFQDRVIERGRLCEFEAGQPIYQLGDPPGGIYGLVEGGVAISIAPGEHEPQFAHFAVPGIWLGETAVITRQPRRVGLRCTRYSWLLQLPLAEIDSILREDPAAWRLLALISIGHMDTAIGAAEDLMIRDPDRRCVATVLRLAGCRYDGPGQADPLDVDISQEDLAHIANLSRNAVGTILRDLKTRRLISLRYRRIQILDAKALRGLLMDGPPP